MDDQPERVSVRFFFIVRMHKPGVDFVVCRVFSFNG